MLPTSLVRCLVFVIPSSDNVFQYIHGKKEGRSTTISIVYFSDVRTRQGQSDAMGGVTDEGEALGRGKLSYFHSTFTWW